MTGDIRIFRAAADTFRTLRAEASPVLKITWLPVAMVVAADVIIKTTGSNPEAFDLPFWPARYLLFVAEALLESIAFVSLFRLLVLGDVSSVRHLRLGNFNIPLCVQFGRRELFYALWTVASGILFLAIPDAARYAVAVHYAAHPDALRSDFGQLMHNMTLAQSVLMFVQLFALSLLSFTWVYLSVAEKADVKGFKSSIRAMYGHILSAVMLNLIFLAPYFIYSFYAQIFVKLHPVITTSRPFLRCDAVAETLLLYFGSVMYAVFIAGFYKTHCHSREGGNPVPS